MTEHFTLDKASDLAEDVGLLNCDLNEFEAKLQAFANAAVNLKLQEWGSQEPVAKAVSLTTGIGLQWVGDPLPVGTALTPVPCQPVNAELVAAVQANHEWHQYHGGYPGSDLEDQNITALANAKAAPVQGVPGGWKLVPLESSEEASDAIDARLKEYNCPANPKNAARAGWRACRLFAAAPQQEQKGGE